MNKDILKGRWNEIKGSIQKKWGKLTDDEIAQINGDFNKLVGQIQKSYGLEREEAERQLKEWDDRMAA